MKVSDRMTITKRSSDGAFYGEKDNTPYVIERSNENYSVYDGFYSVMRSTPWADRPRIFNEIVDTNRYPAIFGMTETATKATSTLDPKKILLKGIKHLMDFFSEFSFTPSFRFTNTFAYMACQSAEQATDYVNNYFALMDSSYVKEVEQNVKSDEFKQSIKDLAQYDENGKAVEYGIMEEPVENYMAIIAGDAETGFTITNKYTAPEKPVEAPETGDDEETTPATPIIIASLLITAGICFLAKKKYSA